MRERQWPQMTFEEYHAADGVSSGALKAFAKDGPLAWWQQYVAGRTERKDTVAMRLGRAFHMAMSDPAGYQQWYTRIPSTYHDDDILEDVVSRLDSRGSHSKAQRPTPGEPINNRTDAGRMYLAGVKTRAELNGREFLTDLDIELVDRQVAAVWDNTACRDYLSEGGFPERACLWECPESGLAVKALADFDMPDSDTYIEFKTSLAPNPYQFIQREWSKLGYGHQVAHYRYVLGRANSIVITVTSRLSTSAVNPPCVEALLYNVPRAFVEMEHEKNLAHLQQMAQLWRQVEGAELDSDGIPDIFHNEGWGGEIDPREFCRYMTDMPSWADTEVMEV